jgi:hypothetical protein
MGAVGDRLRRRIGLNDAAPSFGRAPLTSPVARAAMLLERSRQRAGAYNVHPKAVRDG